MTVISGVSSDKTKIVKFNKMMRKDSDSPSWKANISDNPLVDAFPESIDIHPGLQSSPIAPAQVQSTLSDLTSRKRTRSGRLHQRTLLRNKVPVLPFLYQALQKQRRKQGLRRHSYQRTSALG